MSMRSERSSGFFLVQDPCFWTISIIAADMDKRTPTMPLVLARPTASSSNSAHKQTCHTCLETALSSVNDNSGLEAIHSDRNLIQKRIPEWGCRTRKPFPGSPSDRKTQPHCQWSACEQSSCTREVTHRFIATLVYMGIWLSSLFRLDLRCGLGLRFSLGGR